MRRGSRAKDTADEAAKVPLRMPHMQAGPAGLPTGRLPPHAACPLRKTTPPAGMFLIRESTRVPALTKFHHGSVPEESTPANRPPSGPHGASIPPPMPHHPLEQKCATLHGKSALARAAAPLLHTGLHKPSRRLSSVVDGPAGEGEGAGTHAVEHLADHGDLSSLPLGQNFLQTDNNFWMSPFSLVYTSSRTSAIFGI